MQVMVMYKTLHQFFFIKVVRRLVQNICIDRQLGPAAVSCICAPGYTGDLCEAQLAPPGEISFI